MLLSKYLSYAHVDKLSGNPIKHESQLDTALARETRINTAREGLKRALNLEELLEHLTTDPDFDKIHIYHMEDNQREEIIRGHLKILYFTMMYRYWIKERKICWLREHVASNPIPYILERAVRRLEPYKHEWWKRRFKTSHQGKYTNFIQAEPLAPLRRPTDWYVTTHDRVPISTSLLPFQYCPCYIDCIALSHFYPEEAKWWLDGLRARHLEFEEHVVDQIVYRKHGESFRFMMLDR